MMLGNSKVKAANRPSVFYLDVAQGMSVTQVGFGKVFDVLETLDIGQEKKKTWSKAKRAGG